MDENFFSTMITHKMEAGEMKPFGWHADVWEFRIDRIEEVVGDGFIINCSSENLVEGKKMNDTRFKKHIVLLDEEISEYITIRRDQNLKDLGI